MAKTSRQRRLIVFLGAAALATLALAAVSLWRAAPRLVTWAALRDASSWVPAIAEKSGGSPGDIFEFRLWGSSPPVEKATQEAANALAAEYGSLFRAGYFDHAYVVDRIPTQGCTTEALPALLLIGAYLNSCDRFGEDLLLTPPESNPAIAELLNWVRPVLMSAKAKEALVCLLIEPYELLPGRREPAHTVKMVLLSALTLQDASRYGFRNRRRPEEERLASQVLSGISPREWSVVLSHSRFPAERVRAGSLLLLCHHPKRETFLARARAALEDPSELVRIAAAGALAYHRDPGGKAQLITGLGHARWEVRWWCGRSLTRLGGEEARLALSQQHDHEPDGWVKRQMEDMMSGTW